MVIKRKAVVNSDEPFKRSRTSSKQVKAEAEDAAMEEEVQDEEVGEEQEEEQEEETQSPEEILACQEKEIAAARTKELKGMYLDELKKVVSSKGLEITKKEHMIKAVLEHEVQERSKIREHEAKIRAAVVGKQDEFNALPAPALKQLCNQKGIAGNLSKQARVELLLKNWQEDDGVDKALAKMAQNARELELKAMDATTLKQLCDFAGVSPFVKEIIVDRIVRCEGANGRFEPPALRKDEEEQEETPGKPSNFVDAILANEAQRKKEKELQQQQEEIAAKKFKEVKAMSIDDLKKALGKKGKKDATGKKDELAQALFLIYAQEEEAAAKKAKLQAMAPDQLKKLATSKGIRADTIGRGGKDKIIELIFAEEANVREALAVHEEKLEKVLAKKKEELESKTGSELKDLCVSKGLAAGVAKEGRVERLVQEAKESGEMNKIISAMDRDARTSELNSSGMDALLNLCDETGADPLVKDVMLERLLAYESTFGPIKAKVSKTGKVSKN